VQGGDQIRSVIHRDVRLRVQHRVDVLIVSFVVLALNGENRNAMMLDEGSRHIVLRGEGIRRAQRDLRAPRLQGDCQVRRFGGHVQARRQPDAFQRLLAGKPLANKAQHGHVLLCPLDAQLPLSARARSFTS
jgi:hypothetical protein